MTEEVESKVPQVSELFDDVDREALQRFVEAVGNLSREFSFFQNYVSPADAQRVDE